MRPPSPPASLRHQVPLAPLTSLGVGGAAALLATVGSAAAATAACRWARAAGLPVTALGGGTNALVADAGVPGLVLVCADRTLTVRPAGGALVIEAGAGVMWDDLVAASVAQGVAHLACLSGIPGTVGAAPVQNIGAYGQQLADCLDQVTVVATDGGGEATVPAAYLALGYRTSAFKGGRRRGEIIVGVKLVVPRAVAAPPRHPELVGALGTGAPTAAALRAAVLALRARKGMLWRPGAGDLASAGSFFLNPVVDAAAAARVAAVATTAGAGQAMPQWPEPDGRIKLSAAWLVERAGFARGHVAGRVGLSPRHALALINRGGAQAGEIWALAGQIQAAVASRFGVALAAEPARLGAW